MIERSESMSGAGEAGAHLSDLLNVIGKWCYLLDPRCKGLLVMAQEVSRSGMRMVSAGVVPHDEYRLATDAEIEAWLVR